MNSSTYKSTRQICLDFSHGKIITRVKNPNLEITLIKSNKLSFIVTLMVIFISIFKLFAVLNESEKSIAVVLFLILIGLFIYSVLTFNRTRISGNKLIVQNMLRTEKVIDLDMYPRIYSKYTKRESYKDNLNMIEYYDLYIEQNDTIIKLNMLLVSTKNLNLFIDNFEFKDREEITEDEWILKSSNDREKSYFSYMNFLNKREKIIGIKDTSKVFNIKKDSSIHFYFLSCVLIGLIILALYLFFVKSFLMAGFITLLVFILLVVLKEEKSNLFINISFPSDGIIRLNNYILDFKNNDITFYIKAIEELSSFEKYKYLLIISGKVRTYSIDLNNSQEQEIGAFFDNLIFEEIKK